MESKVCTKCHREKPIDDFYRRGQRGRQATCKKCSNKERWKNGRFKDEAHKEKVLAANRASYARHAEKYRNQSGKRNAAYKLRGIDYLGGECKVCKIAHPAVLQFHHRNPDEKLFNVSTALTAPNKHQWDQMVAELDKCDLLCSNCHSFLHSRRDYEGFNQETWEVKRATAKGEAFLGEHEG